MICTFACVSCTRAHIEGVFVCVPILGIHPTRLYTRKFRVEDENEQVSVSIGPLPHSSAFASVSNVVVVGAFVACGQIRCLLVCMSIAIGASER